MPLPFNYTSEDAIKKVQDNQEGLKLNGMHQLPSTTLKLLGTNINTSSHTKQNSIIHR